MDNNSNKTFQTDAAPMVIRVVAKCICCGNRETLYIAENYKDEKIKHTCSICKNEDFIITYR